MKFLTQKVDQTVDGTIDRSIERNFLRLADKVKLHFRTNKKVYLGVGGGLALGLLVNGRRDVADVYTQRVVGKAGDMTITNNKIEVNLARRGHPGNVVVCKETGEAFASQSRAADATGVNRGNLSRHLSGQLSSVNGLTFEKVGEAQ